MGVHRFGYVGSSGDVLKIICEEWKFQRMER